jgi:hypothetical protein
MYFVRSHRATMYLQSNCTQFACARLPLHLAFPTHLPTSLPTSPGSPPRSSPSACPLLPICSFELRPLLDELHLRHP